MFLQTASGSSEIKPGVVPEIKIPHGETETRVEAGEVLQNESLPKQTGDVNDEAQKLAEIRLGVMPEGHSATQVNPIIEEKAEFSAQYADTLAKILNEHKLGEDPADLAASIGLLPAEQLEK